jgi:hypothetical protein
MTPEHVYPFGTRCRFAGLGCREDLCMCADWIGHFCPLECVTCHQRMGDQEGQQ